MWYTEVLLAIVYKNILIWCIIRKIGGFDMLEIIKFKSILKKNKNVFKDIISDMTIKSLKGNNIILVDSKGNEIISEINDSNIIFRFDDC